MNKEILLTFLFTKYYYFCYYINKNCIYIIRGYIFLAEKEADNVIKEFLRNSEEERQTQAELVKREKQEEMRLLSSCHSEQFLLRTKDTLREYLRALRN